VNKLPDSDIDHTQYPLVSIALCVYNGEKYLKEQLDSLVKQTYPNIEIVVVDDGSRDRSREILREYQQQYPVFRVFENEVNLGYVKNFEKAIGLCEGEYIALCDQDDIWDLEKISKQVAGIGDSLLIYHDSAFMDEQGKPMTWKKKMSDIIHLYSGDDPKVFLYFNCVSGHSILFKRDLRDEFLPFNPDHFHDHWIAYVAANLGSIEVINETLVNYRQHTSTSSARRSGRITTKTGISKSCGETSNGFSNAPLSRKTAIRRFLTSFLHCSSKGWIHSSRLNMQP
jgi:glycosyltransferase involved in cell wall biosynthesis